MRRDSDPYRWIRALTIDQARQHLHDRGLDARGILPVLRARLFRYESEADGGIMPLERERIQKDANPEGEGAGANPETPRPTLVSFEELKRDVQGGEEYRLRGPM